MPAGPRPAPACSDRARLNTFGQLLRVTTFGESHGPAIGCVVDGCPPLIPLTEADLQPWLDRRKPGGSRFVKSDLFDGLQGEHYDLIVTNPPYVTNDETDALPREYAHEPELGLRAGDDGLDLALRIMRDAPLHLDRDGLLIC